MFRIPKSSAVMVTGLVLGVLLAKPLSAQGAKSGAKSGTTGAAKSTKEAAPVQGAWSGTATVQLGDSTLTVPVMYTFVSTNGATSGTAVVPGQGSGQISHVVRDGARLRFRVTAPEGRLLDHDGQVAGEQLIEGMVFMDQKPLAKFRITPAKVTPKPAPR